MLPFYQSGALLFTEMVHCYLPKWCTLIYRNGAFPFTDIGALLFTDHTGVLEDEIIAVAEKYNTHLGIVLGRLQHLQMVLYSFGNKIKSEIVSF